MNRLRRGLLRAVLAAGAALLVVAPTVTARAADYATVTGSGSTWSQVAIDAWRVDVARNGLTVNYSGNGSTSGRLDFINGLSDFAVSEIPFQSHPEDGSAPEVSRRPFGYLPIVAGGTSFMYHLTVAGHRVTDLRLSGETLTKIFTGVITNWSDPAITKDYGKQLPNEPITPVLRSDGSGTSAQFTLWMSKRYPSLWNAFCVKYAKGTPPCGLYSFYPSFPGSRAQSGSNGVADYVASSYAEGTITYVEYAYPLNLGYPVVSLLNSAGYYVQPTASDVAVALTKAGINSDLTQNLDGVYANSDPRAYPLSSYSYMIVPTDTTSPFNTDKGRTLSTFIDYFLCAGQQKAATLGYSPLPINLVEAGFDQVRRIPGNVGALGNSQLGQCHNPTFDGGVNTLLKNAPYPKACQKVGSAPCGSTGTTTSSSGSTGTGRSSSGGSSSGGASPGGSKSGSTGAAGTTGGSGAAAAGSTGSTAAAGAAGAAGAAIDPLTGRPVTSSGTAATGSTAADLTASTVSVPATRGAGDGVLYTLAAVELLAALAMPPLVATVLRRRTR